MTSFQLSLFGTFNLTVDGAPVSRFRSQREAALLAYLAVEAQQAHRRERLAGLLWPDKPEAVARQNLRQTLTNLRAQLHDDQREPPFLLAERHTVQFNRASSYTLDVATFAAAHAATTAHVHTTLADCTACQAQLAAAVALYRGPFLDNFPFVDSDLFAEWLLFTREQFHHQALNALNELGAIALQQTDWPQALRYARRQLDLDLLNEHAHRQLLTALVASGDRNGALVQFDSFSARLRSELEVEPSAETLALIQQIRTDGFADPVAPRPTEKPTSPALIAPSAPLPVAERPTVAPKRHDWDGTTASPIFVGRKEEEAQLQRWLQEGVRVISIWGLAGMGKTTLAQVTARNQAAAFPVIIWRSLINALPLASLLTDWLTVFDDQGLAPAPETVDHQMNSLFEHLRQQRALLVLDNIETIMQPDLARRFRPDYAGYGQLFQRLAHEAHQSVLLLTSREQPQLFVHLEEETTVLRSLPLVGLSQTASQQLLTAYGLPLLPQDAAPLIERFSGNPALLKFVTYTIQDLFGGNVTTFLAESSPMYGDIRDLFEQYRSRMPYIESVILGWLSVACQPMPMAKLRAALISSISANEFLEAIHSLQRRGLLEQRPAGFTTPHQVMYGMLSFMLELLSQEIIDGKPGRTLYEIALLDAQAAEDVRQSQLRVLIAPLVEQLYQHFSATGLITRLEQMLDAARHTPLATRNYLGENLVTLLTYVIATNPLAADDSPRAALALATALTVEQAALTTPHAEPLAGRWGNETPHQTSERVQYDQLRESARQPLTLFFLPEQLTPLIGRERELAEIVERLQQPHIRLLTLVGAGGMGKTALALAVAHSLVNADVHQTRQPTKSQAPSFRDGVFFVALSPLTNVAALPSAIGTTMGLSLQGGDPRLALGQQLRHKQVLLILDNLEHLLHEAGGTQGGVDWGIDFIVTLLQSAPGVRIIATSRERLNLRGEHLYHVQPLAFSEQAHLEQVAGAPALRLFVQSAQRGAADFTLTAENLPVVLHICRLVQGIPLGLELAAANVGLLPLAEIASEIERSAEFLAVDWRDAPKRQRSMRAVFDWSWQLLNDVEQRTLRQLAIFRGGFTREAAQQVTGAGLPALTSLMRKSLLQRTEAGVTGERFHIHELLRQFAAEQLARAAELAVAEERHGYFYLTFVANRAKRLARREPRPASDEIQAEMDNVRQAWTWAAYNGQISLLEQATYGWWQFCLFRGLGSEGRRTFALAVEGVQWWLAALGEDPAARQQGEQVLSKLLAIHANYLFAQGQDEVMATQAREAIALGVASGGVEGETLGTFVLGRVLQELDLRRESGAAWEKTIALARAYQPRLPASELLHEAEWMALNWLRGYAIHFNDFASARSYIVQALQLCRALGKQRGELFCSADLAWTDFFMCNFAAARQGFSETLHLADALGYAWGAMMAQLGLGEMMRLNGEYGAAQILLSQAVKLATAINDQYEEMMSLCRLLRLYAYLGDSAGGQETYARLVHMVETTHPPKECRLNSLLAFSVRAQSMADYPTALVHAQRAWQIVQMGDLLSRRADAAMILGHAQAAMQQWLAAAAAYREAITCYQQLGNPSLTVEAQAGLAQIALAQGDLRQAQQWVESLLPVLAEHPRAGFTTPFGTYLTSYRVLIANQDARASYLLDIAHNLLQEYAENIHNEHWRTTFWENVTVHRQLQQAYAQEKKQRTTTPASSAAFLPSRLR